LQDKLKKSGTCNDISCLQTNQEWKKNKCKQNADATYYLLMKPDPPKRAAKQLFSEKTLPGYLESFTNSCLSAYLISPPEYPFTNKQKKAICECAANMSLELTEANTLLQISNGKATQDVIQDITFISQYAKNICAFKFSKSFDKK
jgi:hypothetical protein